MTSAARNIINNYLANTLKHIEKIIDKGQTDKSRKRDPLLEHYIRQFYLYTPVDVLTMAPAMLYAAAANHWDFIKTRPEKQVRKVRAYNPTLETHGWESDHTVLEFCTADSPFLYDSVSAELERQNIRIFQVMHPVLQLKRDKSGHIVELFGSEPKMPDAQAGKQKIPQDVQLESAMHFQINYIEKEKDLRQLEADIENVLQFVFLAVQDWQKMRARALDLAKDISDKSVPFSKDQVQEVSEFLRWLENKNYIFLGYREYNFVDAKGKPELSVVKNSELGVFRASEHGTKPKGLTEIPPKSVELLTRKSLLEISKSARKSVVHRPVHMDYVGIKKFDKHGNVVGEYRFLGLFTSIVYHQSVLQAPVMRRKFEAVVGRSGLKADSHSGKSLAAILENYPRDELLQTEEDELLESCMSMLELTERPQAKLFTRIDKFSRFASCIVFIPRDRFTTQVRLKVAEILERAYNGTVTDHYSQVTESPLARVHFMLRLIPNLKHEPDMKRVQEEIAEVTGAWVNGLQDVLVKHMGARKGEQLLMAYVNAFPDAYRNLYHFGGTYCDITKIEEAYRTNNLTLDLYQLEADDETFFQLKLFHPESLVQLSSVMPILENMGFEALDELTFHVRPYGKVYGGRGMWVHHFRLKVSRATLFEEASKKHGSNLSTLKPEFEEALKRVWVKEMESDALNKLILRANLHWRDVVMLRAYCKYILQVGFPYSREYIASAVARHPVLVRSLTHLFHARFAPELKEGVRAQKVAELEAEITARLSEISDVTEDRILRQFYDTIRATLRTNYFQKDASGATKAYLSFKFDSSKVPNLPKPKPYAEIFVYSYDMEGVHLRGGKVARGGLRWSDRIEDFRTEVLGLVKAQMVKNSVIVPVGSKGGFVVKRPARDNQGHFQQQGVAAYRTFLSGLLDLTDNIKDGKIVPPKQVVRHDGDDPYLVVAADKGTATFSDIANGISRDYGFWMDDAFASGGSAGYDHKKMGITARGGWVCVQRHFAEMGRDTQKEPFTVVGIGGMSGDVFGNGMLLSDKIMLVAAFNHQHIFIDPTPDTAKSFVERKRLFALPTSGWGDYDAKLITKGGGVFERKAKSIPVSKQMKELFDIEADTITPDALIQALLKARVDLIWNGGIGTYVKAETESHADVGDKANDNLRINGKELRCKVIGEGGNLGCTQKGRIEAAQQAGVRLNTDAIDNSGGVDCSDHEVNMKIAFSAAVQAGELTIKARDKLLADMTDEVGELVLRTNRLQAQAISVSEAQGVSILENEAQFMRALEKKGALDRKIEFLPDVDAIKRRASAMQGLTRPELAVLLAYSKIDLFNDLMQSSLPDDPYCNRELVEYFPVPMQKKFAPFIKGHALRKEIIATVLSNGIVNRMGNTFYHRMRENFGIKGCDAARAFIVTRDIFGLEPLWEQIDGLGTNVPAAIKIELQLEIRRLVERATSWFLRHYTAPLNISELVEEFGAPLAEMQKYVDSVLSPVTLQARDERLAAYTANNVPAALAKAVANLEPLLSGCDIVHVARKQKFRSIKEAGEIYYRLGTRLKLGWLRQSARGLYGVNHWENMALQSQIETLYDLQMKLTQQVVKSIVKSNAKNAEQAVDKWLNHHEKAMLRYDGFISDMERQDAITPAILTIALQRVSVLGK